MSDWERYYFDKSPCFEAVVEYLKKVEKRESLDPQEVLQRKEVQAYGGAVTRLFDEGESEESLQQYKAAVVNLLFGDQGNESPDVESRLEQTASGAD